MPIGKADCLPERVRAMMLALCQGADHDVPALAEDGCQCASRRLCDLWFACEGIHRAFTPSSRG
ncbi:conserved hypothetical protein [Magnetospirillum molischianum DSM 120]|uniref:Uncharacterized protein n=1 Tax=Magnetospirillum molischianum DSM 120 TaxID=1150626 RepID=H8FVZ4_MAGML|nr:conserved hypothetical protein [Magnetospirillum molischianum DSM 120]